MGLNSKINTSSSLYKKYLNEFRTSQCPLFLEQQCQNHRPYTCFYWHFPNQRRRRPVKREDGTFNYNPDVYCDKYDENAGTCPDGDACPYAHRNAGDTERRYHPRYFKTGNCIYETTETGACVKNGLHCAFAHGPDDLRLPVYDIREIQDSSSKERVLSEDPKWNGKSALDIIMLTYFCVKFAYSMWMLVYAPIFPVLITSCCQNQHGSPQPPTFGRLCNAELLPKLGNKVQPRWRIYRSNTPISFDDYPHLSIIDNIFICSQISDVYVLILESTVATEVSHLLESSQIKLKLWGIKHRCRKVKLTERRQPKTFGQLSVRQCLPY
ncbi:unnamed protein product [Schistocephalus solidus]|uniref:C3H1-type domain-containing protein n=1 Tax=Schistocephalus solidus TaxID=70667 RepID=A0A183TIG3_SCHSO|nr:unnamed protein product [Schistocephalus solidus]